MTRIGFLFAQVLGSLIVSAAALLISTSATAGHPGESPDPAAARGAYLARIGNCAGCHTVVGGQAYAGGRAINTPFGLVYSSNLTPDAATGIGAWQPADFWQALHHGKSRDGRLLYPAFPYVNTTKITRADADDLLRYLKTLEPVSQANRDHQLDFPVNTQIALKAWRALYFEPGVFSPAANRSARWNRGAYLVQGLGHCSACHGARNSLGALKGPDDLSGGMIDGLGWYAPSLNITSEAGLAHWTITQIVKLLRDGRSAHGSVIGPMADVVFESTQYLTESDLQAMAVYLRALPVDAGVTATPSSGRGAAFDQGKQLYDKHCADCHGDVGLGSPDVYPPLAGNRAVKLSNIANLVHVVLDGGFLPATARNPRPYSMPPFAHLMTDNEIAAVLTYIRNAWGNQAPAVGTHQVVTIRDRKKQ